MRQYFEKIKQFETIKEAEAGPTTTLNKPAAGRVIKHALVGHRSMMSGTLLIYLPGWQREARRAG